MELGVVITVSVPTLSQVRQDLAHRVLTGTPFIEIQELQEPKSLDDWQLLSRSMQLESKKLIRFNKIYWF